MSAELLEIQPRELKFIFELKKQSSCSIRLINKSNNHVAFKVKTTSPKKYSVRPNTGIVKPKSSCDFSVTMQAQRSSPPDMICKDKFLVQSTVVPAGTIDEDITSSMFVKDDGRYIEENKLRVILVSPPNSPVLSPINGTLKQEQAYEVSILKDRVLRKAESFTPYYTVTEGVEESKIKNSEEAKPAKDVGYKTTTEIEEPAKDAEYKTMKEVDEPSKEVGYKTMKEVEEPAKDVWYKTTKEVEEPAKDVGYQTTKEVEEPAKDVGYKTTKEVEYKTMKDTEEPAKDVEYKTMKDTEEPAKDVEYKTMKDTENLNLVKDIEEMKSKLNEIESKLSEAEVTISKLKDERRWTAQESESLRQELALLRSKGGTRKVQVGFPLLFVCMVALISVMLGYLLHN